MIDFEKIMLLLLLLLCLSCCGGEEQQQPVVATKPPTNLEDRQLAAAISHYLAENITNTRVIDKVLRIKAVSMYPERVLEFYPVDHHIKLFESFNYQLIYINQLPVLIEPFYKGLIQWSIDTAAVKNAIRPILQNQPEIARTGQRADTWYVILRADEYEPINVTDSISHHGDFEKAFVHINAKVFPCIE
ncbi:MAG: hypothetical protein AAF990_17160 [Bacteroidota bacterium]